MPLSKSVPRKSLHQRQITCQGYEREDGMWDIEVHLLDTRSRPTSNQWRGEVAAGAPIHEMWLRWTVDENIVIRAIEVVMDAAPFPQRCPAVPPNYQRLVGVSVAKGFIKEAQARIGRTENCTHLATMMQVAATCTMQTLYAGRSSTEDMATRLKIFNSGSDRPPLLNTCHSYAEDSPIIQKIWPAYYVEKNR